jgi:hypothetical protein
VTSGVPDARARFSIQANRSSMARVFGSAGTNLGSHLHADVPACQDIARFAIRRSALNLGLLHFTDRFARRIMTARVRGRANWINHLGDELTEAFRVEW